MDVTRFLREGAKFMAADRPDIWTVDSAFDVLVKLFSDLAGQDGSGEIRVGGFALQKYVGTGDEEGLIEYNLHRQVLTFEIWEDENVTAVYDWTDCSALSNIGLDVPDPFDSDLDNDS